MQWPMGREVVIGLPLAVHSMGQRVWGTPGTPGCTAREATDIWGQKRDFDLLP